nr:uncharacterized protein LOC109192344 isoform X2 [Ipomoea batatas]
MGKGGKSCPQYAKGQKRPVGVEPGKTRSGSQKQFQEQVSMKSRRDVTFQQRPKPVDEDLYKIPPELLHQGNRKKVFGFFSRCLAPPCIA